MPACVGNLSLSLSLSLPLSLSLYSEHNINPDIPIWIIFSQSTMETWKLFKIRIKLVLEKIQLNFLWWLEIIYLGLSIYFGVLTLLKPGPVHSSFFSKLQLGI